MSEISFDFEKVHKLYGEIYRHILRHIYPAKNSTGFPERNLSVNFSKAYEAVYSGEGCFTWYELQFGDKNNLHYDACIVDETNRRIILVESKRFSNLNKKITEIGVDINRIQSIKKIAQMELNNRIPRIEAYEIYGLILADAWEETTGKIEVIRSFENSTFLNQYATKLGAEIEQVLPQYHAELIKKFENNKYYLLSFIWRVV